MLRLGDTLREEVASEGLFFCSSWQVCRRSLQKILEGGIGVMVIRIAAGL